MKKLFIVMAVACFGFVACNNESTTETTREDSARIADSIRNAEASKMAPIDTTTKIDTNKVDTTKH